MSESEVSGQRIKSFLERIERLEDEKKAISEDIKDIYAEAKGTGFSTKIIKAIIKLRKVSKEKRQEEQGNKKTSQGTTSSEKFKPDMSKTLAQKKAELEYKKQADLANAKEEEKYLIGLKYKTASAVLDAEDKYNKAIAGAKNQETAKKAMDELISSVGQ